RGRTVSLNLNTRFNDQEGETNTDAINRYYKGGSSILEDTTLQFSRQDTRGNNISANIAYTEPIGKGQLQFNYNPSFSTNKRDQRTLLFEETANKFNILDSSQSNVLDNTYNTQNAGISYRLGDRERMFSVGLSYQH